jgi:oxygen-dependent protoporphyrinogen oxidase
VLVRCFFTGRASIEEARRELREILGIEQEPTVARVFELPRAHPVYEVGYAERIHAIEAALPPAVHLAGGAYHGVGVPDCISDARRVAESVAGAVQRSTVPEPSGV